MEPSREQFIEAVTPRSFHEAAAIYYAVQLFMNECSRRKEAGEEYSSPQWSAAGDILQRGFKALGLTAIETTSPARVVAVMRGEPDPGEPKKDEPS